jgi:phage tail tape-measure protein
VGLGGFAQAAAFALQAYQGGSAQAMAEMNPCMYAITVAEHAHFKILYFGYRGTPVGIDLFRVVETGTVPVVDAGVAGRDGGQIGAGVLYALLEVLPGRRGRLRTPTPGMLNDW